MGRWLHQVSACRKPKPDSRASPFAHPLTSVGAGGFPGLAPPPTTPSVPMTPDKPRRATSGIEIDPVYGPAALAGWDPARALGEPGAYPYTRGPHPPMYLRRLWTMRQYAGFGPAAAPNDPLPRPL